MKMKTKRYKTKPLSHLTDLASSLDCIEIAGLYGFFFFFNIYLYVYV